MPEKLKEGKSGGLSKKAITLIFFAFSFHLVGIISSLLRPKKDVPFDLRYHLLRFFSWWSVHASLLTILAAILIWRERKTASSYFSQLLIFVAAIYNLVTFCFISSHFLIGKLKSYGVLLDLQLFGWHFVAPFLTILYFYFYARINKLREKLIKTFSFSLIFPVFYFFYAFILAKIHGGNSEGSLFPYMEKYPYYIFEWIADREWNLLIINFLIAILVFFSLCSLIIWTKLILDKKLKKK